MTEYLIRVGPTEFIRVREDEPERCTELEADRFQSKTAATLVAIDHGIQFYDIKPVHAKEMETA